MNLFIFIRMVEVNWIIFYLIFLSINQALLIICPVLIVCTLSLRHDSKGYSYVFFVDA
jgi:hypothetical protein